MNRQSGDRCVPATLQFLIAMIACATNERLQRKLDCTREEGRVLKEVVRAISGTGRIAFTAEQRRHLAIAGLARGIVGTCRLMRLT